MNLIEMLSGFNPKQIDDAYSAFKATMGQKMGSIGMSPEEEQAQRQAALPVQLGGLGLPPNNTAEDRQRAMMGIRSR